MKMPNCGKWNGMATSEREWNQLWTNSCKHFLSGGVKEIVGLFFYFFIIIIIICLCGFEMLGLDNRGVDAVVLR